MNIAIDAGNSSTKIALIEEGRVVETLRTTHLDREFLHSLWQRLDGRVKRVVLSSVVDVPAQVEEFLNSHTDGYLRVTAATPMPLRNLYATPHTLGIDRLAAAVGAATIYPSSNVLVVDLGTAMTVDIVTARGEFLGGNITLGAEGRFRALNQFTARLPLVEKPDEEAAWGYDTASAIQSGVVRGMTYELEGYIARANEEFEDLKIIFTGGDAKYFAKRLKNAIFATSDLVVLGLNTILEYNATN